MALSPDEIKAIRACNSRKDVRLAAMLDDAESLQATIMLSNNFVNVMVVLLCNYAFGRMFDFSSLVLQFVVVAALVFFLLLLFAEVLPKIYSMSTRANFWAWSAVAPQANRQMRKRSFFIRYLVFTFAVSRKADGIRTPDR